MRAIKGVVIAGLAVSVLAASCSGGDEKIGPAAKKSSGTTTSQNGQGEHKKGGTVTIANVGGQTWPCQFNPFNPAVSGVSQGSSTSR
jgi:peptide/nickel transport system substrate-binding protein